MPRRDRTGPMGAGPTTGWGAGDCAEQEATSPSSILPRWGYGRGGGFGRGAGRRARFQALRPRDAFGRAPRISREQEASWLKSRVPDLQDALERIKERLQVLDKE